MATGSGILFLGLDSSGGIGYELELIPPPAELKIFLFLVS
jgi:hypothetical protein